MIRWIIVKWLRSRGIVARFTKSGYITVSPHSDPEDEIFVSDDIIGYAKAIWLGGTYYDLGKR